MEMTNPEQDEEYQRRITFINQALDPLECGLYIIFVPTIQFASRIIWPQVLSCVAEHRHKDYRVTQSELRVTHSVLSKDDCSLTIIPLANEPLARTAGLRPTKYIAIGEFSPLAEKVLEDLGASMGLYKKLKPKKSWWEFWK